MTACFVFLTAAILSPLTSPPGRGNSGVRMVGLEKDVTVYGPELPASLDTDSANYGVVSGASAPVVAEVEEIAKTYVYANDSGQ